MKTHLHSIRRPAHLTLAALAIAAAASVSAQTVITPDLKAPPSAYNTSSTGMVLRAHQIAAARTPGDQNSIANVLKELSGGFGPNLATNGPLTGGLWSEVYLNHSTDWPLGPADGDWVNFGDWALPFPGVNSDTAQTGGFSTFAYEIITYLDLPAGTNTLVVGSGDSFRLTIGVGDNPYSFAAVQAGQFSGSRNYGPSVFDIDVQSAGVYPVRIIYGQGGGINGLQFYSTNGDRYSLLDQRPKRRRDAVDLLSAGVVAHHTLPGVCQPIAPGARGSGRKPDAHCAGAVDRRNHDHGDQREHPDL